MRHALLEQKLGGPLGKAMKSLARRIGTRFAESSCMRTLVLLLVLTLTACFDALPEETALPDAAPFVESECELEFEQVYVMDTIELLPAGEGLDLDGDGNVDNVLGVFADVINPSFRRAVAFGTMNYLWELRQWSGPPVRDAAQLEIAFYKGIDADSPADPSNNLHGDGRFLVGARQFDILCQPTSRFESAKLANGAVTAQTSLWEFVQPDLGTVRLADFRFEWQFSPDMGRWSGLGGGIVTFCGLSNAPIEGDPTRTWLDFMVVQVGLPADIDRDGDGIERVEGDGEFVTRCIDGDSTVIEGSDCPCDPRIADGYSAAFRGTGVPARIVGLFDIE